MSKNRNEEELKQNGLVDRITSFFNKRIILSVLIALFIAISFSYPVVGEVSTISIDTDSSWKCLDAMVDGWTSVDFDDSYWENAKLLDATEAIGYEPEGLEQNVIWYPEEPMPHTCYFRKAFTINGNVIGGKVLIGDDGNTDWYLYVNGKFVGESGFFSGVSEFDIGSYLKSGQNVIAVRAEWHKYGIPCWGLVGTVRTAPAPHQPTTPTPTSMPASSPDETMPPCEKGYNDCYPPWGDCETNIYEDKNNCGDCGIQCPEGYFCLYGSIVPDTTANKEKLATYYKEQCQRYDGEKKYEEAKNYLLKAKDVYIDINRPDQVREIDALIEEIEEKILKREIFELVLEIAIAVILAVFFGYLFERKTKKVPLWVVVASSAAVFFIVFLVLRLWILPIFY